MFRWKYYPMEKPKESEVIFCQDVDNNPNVFTTLGIELPERARNMRGVKWISVTDITRCLDGHYYMFESKVSVKSVNAVDNKIHVIADPSDSTIDLTGTTGQINLLAKEFVFNPEQTFWIRYRKAAPLEQAELIDFMEYKKHIEGRTPLREQGEGI